LSEDDAEDVLQQARLRYFLRRGVDYLDDAEPQPALMNKIIRGVIADYQRQRKRCQRAEQHFAAMHTPCFEEDALLNQLLVKEILARLPARWRKVAYWLLQGLSWREIAQRLNSQVGTVSVQFRRALDKACKELGIECRKKKSPSGIKDGSTRKRKNATPLLGIFPARGILVWGENHAMARDNKANGLDVPDNNLCRFLSPTQANHFRILNVP
jgi:RNA polymerase sigma factor (sigma-70 family)